MEPTTGQGAGIGIRVVFGASALAFGWLLLGAVSGGDSASAAEPPPVDWSLSDMHPASAAVPDSSDAEVFSSSPELLGGLAEVALSTADDVASQLSNVSGVVAAAPVQSIVTPVLHVAGDTLEAVGGSVQAVIPDSGSAVAAVVSIAPHDVASDSRIRTADPAPIQVADPQVSADSHPAPLAVAAQAVRSAVTTTPDRQPWAPLPGAPLGPPDATTASTSTGTNAISDISEPAWRPPPTCRLAVPPRDDTLPPALFVDPDSSPD